ncbi:MAG: DMT family transporter [Symbiobacteriaceae bacterium]|nr:DMT family transporter [Symbiobacteriaceae bacterium]
MRRGFSAILVSSFCFGFIGAFNIWGRSYGFSPMQATTNRFFTATVVFWLIIMLRRRDDCRLSGSDMLLMALQGLGLAFTSICYALALQSLQASMVAVLFYIHPIFTMLGATLVYREPLTRNKVLALMVALGGCILSADPGSLFIGTASPRGVMWILLGGLSYSLFNLFAQRTSTISSPLVSVTWVTTFCTLALFIIEAPRHLLDGSMNLQTWGFSFLFGLICSVIPYFLYLLGVSQLGALLASIAGATEAMFGLLVSIVVLGDRLVWLQALGVPFIFGSVLILQGDLLRYALRLRRGDDLLYDSPTSNVEGEQQTNLDSP